MPEEQWMRPAVESWLRSRGCQVVLYEALQFGVVGARFAKRTGRAIPVAEVIAVELKLTRIAEVICQAEANRHASDESYAAMPGSFCVRMRAASRRKFKTAGVGLLGVFGDRVSVMIPAKKKRLTGEITDAQMRAYHRTLWRRAPKSTRDAWLVLK